MSHHFLCLIVVFFSFQSYGRSVDTVYSSQTGDFYLIYTDLPKTVDSQEMELIVYLDAGLKFGEEVRTLRDTDSIKAFSNSLLVGIAHIGNHRKKRQRDFIHGNIYDSTALSFRNSLNDYGYADRMMAFLTEYIETSIYSKYLKAH